MLERMNAEGTMATSMTEETYEHSFLIERLSEELEDAEIYCKHAKHAKNSGDQQLAAMFAQLSKDELRHFESITEIIDKTIPNIKANPLYPLLEDLEEWAEDIDIALNAYR